MHFDIEQITTQFLADKRLKADPLADQVIQNIIENGSQEEVNKVLGTLMRNHDYSESHFEGLDSHIKNAVVGYFAESHSLPTWADRTLIDKGQEVFSLYGPEIFMLLNVKSLPLCYTCAKGAKVLFTTGRLHESGSDIDPLARRLMETAQMVTNVLSPGSFSEDGNGVVTIQKIRLIHASIRYYLKSKIEWDIQELGEPINQEDLAGTLMSFAPVILSGLKKLNIDFTEEQEAGYSHIWKVIGYLMGLDEDLLPDTFQDGRNLAIKILQHQSAFSEDGVQLTTSCINFLKYLIPGNKFDSIPEYMIWYFMQDLSEDAGLDLSSMIGVHDHKDMTSKTVTFIIRLLVGEVDNIQDHSKLMRHLSGRFNKILLQGIIAHFNKGKNVHFYIPPSLQKNWKLDEEWVDRKVITPNILGNRLAWQQKK